MSNNIPTNILLVLLLSLSSHLLWGSNGKTGMHLAEERINHWLDALAAAPAEEERSIYNDSILLLMRKVLNTPASFSYPFDSLKRMGVVYPPDSTFRIFTWNLVKDDGTYRHFGMIQHSSGRLTELKDEGRQIKDPCRAVLPPDQWYGALYYRILQNRWRNTTYYTLLGLSLNNSLTTRKVIDVLTFDRKGTARFGAPLFEMQDSICDRVIFEFSARVSMLLHYDDRMGMIVFDHLSPALPRYKGMAQYYGPDSSYDGFFFYKGKWRLREDLDVRNKE